MYTQLLVKVKCVSSAFVEEEFPKREITQFTSSAVFKVSKLNFKTGQVVKTLRRTGETAFLPF